MPERVIPELWLPKPRKVWRVIVHWTGGSYTPNWIDRGCYQFLIDGEGKPHRGLRGPGLYLPHTRNLNTGSVGLSICAMRGAIQGRTHGPAPLLKVQWERAAQAAADIVAAYDLALTERTVLFHSEVERVYGVKQKQKWDIDVLPFEPGLKPQEIHEQFRAKVGWYLKQYHGRR